MTMTLQKRLQDGFVREGPDRLLRAMGYTASALPRARQRLRALLADPRLGLASAHYDFHFSSREFLRALAAVLAVAPRDVEEGFRAIDADLRRERAAVRPWLFVDTGFERAGQPLVALAAAESLRRLRLPAQAWRLPREELIALAAERVRRHYRESEGQLPLWGDIRAYLLVVSSEQQVAMDVAGRHVRDEPLRLARRTFMSSS